MVVVVVIVDVVVMDCGNVLCVQPYIMPDEVSPPSLYTRHLGAVPIWCILKLQSLSVEKCGFHDGVSKCPIYIHDTVHISSTCSDLSTTIFLTHHHRTAQHDQHSFSP